MPAVKEMMSGSYHKSPGITRAEGYKWPVKDVPGEFEWVDIENLHVDHAYQRDKLSQRRITDIARSWSWQACGVILVARREDGTLWVYDGQHRTLSARTRGDISQLPCMIFPSLEVRDEAAAFLDANTTRGPVKMLDKFKALLMKKDPTALKVKEMLDEYGYAVSGHIGVGQIACVGALMSNMQLSEKHAKRAFGICVELFDGNNIHERVFQAMCYLDSHLEKSGESICTPHIRQKVMSLGVSELQKAMVMATEFHNKSGQRVWADGIVRLINKGKSKRRIPACISE